jgi:hypothetical protein
MSISSMKKGKNIINRIRALNIKEFPELRKRVESNTLQEKDCDTINELVGIMESLLKFKKRYETK